MSVLVEQQDETINVIESTAANVEKDTEVGSVILPYRYSFHTNNKLFRLGYTEKAVVSARAARKKRWICFILTIVILAIVAIVVAVVVTNNLHKPST